MDRSYTITWAGVESFPGPLGHIENAVHALAMVDGLTKRGVRDIVIRQVRRDGSWRQLSRLELQGLANKSR